MERGARKRRTDLVVVCIAADMVDHGGQVVAAITHLDDQPQVIRWRARSTEEPGKQETDSASSLML